MIIRSKKPLSSLRNARALTPIKPRVKTMTSLVISRKGRIVK